MLKNNSLHSRLMLKIQMDSHESGPLIKSKQRVASHGEVFTPRWMVDKMLNEPAIDKKLQDIHATFLEPSAGEGAFLTEILSRKLTYMEASLDASNKKDQKTWKDNALWCLMSIYGIELLADDVKMARIYMLDTLIWHYQHFFRDQINRRTDFYYSAAYVIKTNIVQGNTLTYKNSKGKNFQFSQWLPVDNGKHVQRVPFTYASLFEQPSLFDDDNLKKYKPCSVQSVYRGKNEIKDDEK